MTQEVALQAIDNKENILVTGSAGVGKTYIMKQAINYNTVVAAPTGIAALNIGGTTCHKLFGLPIGMVTEQDYKVQSKVRDALAYVERVIIDEIGMVRADQLDLMDWKLKKIKGNDKPFGGVQMILVGDFLQLEPIVGYKELPYFRQQYSTPFCFGAEAFNGFRKIELEKVYRQDNKRQVAMLNSIRKKDKWFKHAISNIVKESLPYDEDREVLHLCSYKRDAARINGKWYNKIDAPERTYYALEHGHWKENEIPVPKQLNLKVGCKVIICANDMEGQYVNGDRGEVLSMSMDSVIVKKENGNIVTVQENTWERYGYVSSEGNVSKEVEAEYKQVPLKLGWAVTIHASQGLTLDNIAIDVGDGCFSHGQLYVALSRAKDLRNVSFVTPISHTDAIVREDAINFYN